MTWPAMQIGDSCAVMPVTAKRFRRRRRRRPGAAEPAGGDHADATPLAAVTHLEDLAHACAGQGALPLAAHRAAYWFSTLAPALPPVACHALVDALQHIQRLEAGDHDGHAVLFGQRLVFLDSPSRRRRGRRPESPAPVLGRLHDRGHGRRHQHVGD
jgi:hypothetical protein